MNRMVLPLGVGDYFIHINISGCFENYTKMVISKNNNDTHFFKFLK